MSNLCIIPARGGSKRIPRKNIKSFLGKPIIAYSIEAALKSSLFDTVMVSTDDHEIAAIAKEYGADVPFLRSEETASDFATTFEVIQEVVLAYQDQQTQFENICCLYACAPFVTAEKLTAAYHLLTAKEYDSVFPIIQFGFPIQRALLLDENGKTSFREAENSLKRSQDLPETFHDAGQFHWLKTAACMKKKVLITDNTGAILINEMEGQDIDTEIDWQMAELKYKLLKHE